MPLVGFYDGPASIPQQLFLHGAMTGTAIVRPATATKPETIQLSAVGRVAAAGKATLHGTLRVVGGLEIGTLELDSAAVTLPLQVEGAAPSSGSSSPSALSFDFNGRRVDPNTLFSYQPAIGSGTLTVTLSPGTRRTGAVLQLQSVGPGGTVSLG